MIIPSEITDLIAGSGNTFHAKVARWFQEKGWLTTVSPYYMDESQNKAREIDLICERAWDIKDGYSGWQGEVVLRFFVECKFVPTYSVFWFADKDLSEAKRLVSRSGVFDDNNQSTSRHHYLSGSPQVAKLFASSSQRGADSEPFYKALNQSLNALVSMRGRAALLNPENIHRGKRVVLDFPLIVCSSFDRLYRTEFYNDVEPRKIDDNFQLEVRYAYAANGMSAVDDYFLLDIVEFSKLDKFADAIAVDADLAVFFSLNT